MARKTKAGSQRKPRRAPDAAARPGLAPRQEAPAQQAVVVLGMHRSGTSALTRVFNLLGADLPRNIMGPSNGNIAGHWESNDLVVVHDEMLRSAGSRWDDWRAFNAEWSAAGIADTYKQRILEILTADFAHSPLFLIKDPRICRFFPFWRGLLERFGARISVVIPIRNPLEVAGSLKSRDGFLPAKSCLIWLRHVLEAERATRDVPRAIVTYDLLMNDWRRLADLVSRRAGIKWPRRSDSAALEIDRFLSGGLRHFTIDPAELDIRAGVVDWVKDAHQALCDMAAGKPEAAPRAALDRIAREFDRAAAAFGMALAEEASLSEDRQLENARLTGQIEDVRRAAAARDEAQAEAHRRLDRALADEQARASALTAGLSDSQREIAQLVHQLETGRAATRAATDQIAQLERERDAARAHGEARERELLGLARDLEGARQFLRESQTEVQRLAGELDAARGEAALFEAALAAARGEADEREAGFAADLAAAQAELATARGGGAAARETAHELSAALGVMRGELAERERQAARLAKALDAAQAQNAALTLALEGAQHEHRRALAEAQGEAARLQTELSASRRQAGERGAEAAGLSRDLDEARALVGELRGTLEEQARLANGAAPAANGGLFARARLLWSRQARARAARQAEIDAIGRARLFEARWYLERYPDVAAAGEDPLWHYLQHGSAEGRDPHPLFDGKWYAGQVPELAATGLSALGHYVMLGAAQGRDPHPLFDTDWYLAQNPDVATARVNPLYHFWKIGGAHGRDPHPLFDTSWYLERNPDVARAGDNALDHYLSNGWKEGRDPHPLFDGALKLVSDRVAITSAPKNSFEDATLQNHDQNSGYRPDAGVETAIENAELAAYNAIVESGIFDESFYLSSNPDVAASSTNPIIHYIRHGAFESRDPSPLFSNDWYLAKNADVSARRTNPLLHYIEDGWKEGRDPHPDFSSAWYMKKYPDVRKNPLRHFLERGWREGRDPSENFSTSHYLGANSDIRSGGDNPLIHYVRHGRSEGRSALPFDRRIERINYQPLVSVIVPNYNHARFLPDRLDSILYQSYKNIEVIIIDDHSSDNSIEVIRSYESKFDRPVRVVVNAENSGNVFEQWRRGFSIAKGDLVWVCESDDFCDVKFLEKCIKPLVDRSVMIAFGRIQYCDESGFEFSGLDDYRESAEPGVWAAPLTRFAKEWFSGAFGVSNIIPNVGGCVIRNQTIAPQVWQNLRSYKICGDWYLYSELSNGGRIAYVPDAVSYFRQHGKNTSVVGFKDPAYYHEHEMIMRTLKEKWEVPSDIVNRFASNVRRQFEFSGAEREFGKLDFHFDEKAISRASKERPHVLIAFLGFHLGGGELFPLFLANELVKKGHTVSVLVMNTENESQVIRDSIDKRVAIYEIDFIRNIGVNNFIVRAGIDLIHSHSLVVERFFFDDQQLSVSIPYVSTLHGLYEISDIHPTLLDRILNKVDRWIYLTDKNIRHLARSARQVRATKMINGAPVDLRLFPYTRQELGIPPDAILFTVASRAIEEKGWDVAVAAIEVAQQRTERELHLMLCGSGPVADRLSVELKGSRRFHVMGYQEAISGAYRISDVALLPTRFGGESFPLSLIQAMQVGVPLIATDIGEIKTMMTLGNIRAGNIVEFESDRVAFVHAVAEAILEMVDDEYRAQRAKDAATVGKQYDIGVVADRYASIYRQECETAGLISRQGEAYEAR